MSGDILDLIDSALNDWSVSEDAMRWNSEAGEVEGRCRNSADFSLAMLPAWTAFGEFSLYSEAMTMSSASAQRGDIVTVDGEIWRIADVRETEPGHFTYSLEEVDVEALTSLTSRGLAPSDCFG